MNKSKDDDYIPITINLDDYSMNDTSIYSTASDFTITTATTSSPTYTVSLDSSWDANEYTTDTIDISSLTGDYYNQNFIDKMPDVHRVDEMCKEYPALAKAYETFKSVYKMCEQDYKGKLKERGLDDDIPF